MHKESFRYPVTELPLCPKVLKRFLDSLDRDVRTAEETIRAVITTDNYSQVPHEKWLIWLLSVGLQKVPSYKELVATTFRLIIEVPPEYACLGGVYAGIAIAEHFLEHGETVGTWSGGLKEDMKWSPDEFASAANWAELYGCAENPRNIWNEDPLYKRYSLTSFSYFLRAIDPEACFRSGQSASELFALALVMSAYTKAAKELEFVAPMEKIFEDGCISGPFAKVMMDEIKRQICDWMLPAIAPMLPD